MIFFAAFQCNFFIGLAEAVFLLAHADQMTGTVAGIPAIFTVKNV